MPRTIPRLRLDTKNPQVGLEELVKYLDLHLDTLNDSSVVLPPSPRPAEPVEGQLHFDGESLALYQKGVWVVLVLATSESSPVPPSWVRDQWENVAEELTAMGVPPEDWRYYA